MNAYKLADRIDITKNEKITKWSLLKASVMLRKQQDEIEALKQILAYEGIGVSQEYLDECVADLRKAQEK